MRRKGYHQGERAEKHQQVIRKKEEVIFNAREIHEKPWVGT